MPFIIRNLNTGLFYNPRVWTSIPALAEPFPDIETLEQRVSVLGLADAEAVILSDALKIIGGLNLPALKPMKAAGDSKSEPSKDQQKHATSE